MNGPQEVALELLRGKFDVVGVAAVGVGVLVEVANGPTPYLFIDTDGAVYDEDANGVAL